MMGLIAPTSGTIRFEGRDLSEFGREDWQGFRSRVQFMFQDPVSALSPRLTIRSLLTEPLKIHGREPKAGFARVQELMQAVGLSEDLLPKHPHQISGGQARRVGIARALVLDPSLILADEPTAGLDVSVQGDLLNLLADLRTRYGLTYLMISHNLNVIRKVCDRVAVLYLGQVVEIGASSSVFAAPAHPYTHALIGANPEIDPAKRRERVVLKGEIPSPLHPPAGCRFHTRCPRVQTRCSVEEPLLRPMGDGRPMAACHFPLDAP
jgi:oligopeptide transport system ATP-binding protein